MSLQLLCALATLGLASESACEGGGEGECRWGGQVGEWNDEDAYTHQVNKEIDEVYDSLEDDPRGYQEDERYKPKTVEVCSGGSVNGCVKPGELARLLKKTKQPLIVKGLIEGWPRNKSWSKEAVMREYGAYDVTISLGSLYPAEGGQPERRVRQSLKDLYQRFLPDQRFVAFDKVAPDIHRKLLGSKLLHRLAKGHIPILSAGGPRSGIPWHTHGQSALLCYVGTKRWFAYPPGTASFQKRGHPFLGSMNWTRLILPRLKPDERPVTFMQNPGEFVYLPSAWPHLTMNLDETLCVGWQDWLDDEDLHGLLKGCPASAPSDPDACTLLGEACKDQTRTCPFSREPADFYDDALAASPLHLAAVGHAADFNLDRVIHAAATLKEQEEQFLDDPYVDNLTLAYGWVFLAQTLYNRGGDQEMADAFLSRVGRLVTGDGLAMEALALYDKTNGTKSFDYANDFNESNETIAKRERLEREAKAKRGKGA